MSLRSKLTTENIGRYSTFVFYAAVGIISLIVYSVALFPPQLGLIGILSLITAYGLFTKRAWSIWFVFILLFTATAFSAYMLYLSMGADLLLDLSMIAYLILTWIFTVYVAIKRKTLES